METSLTDIRSHWEAGTIVKEYDTDLATIVVMEDGGVFSINRYFHIDDLWHVSADLSGGSLLDMVDYLIENPKRKP